MGSGGGGSWRRGTAGGGAGRDIIELARDVYGAIETLSVLMYGRTILRSVSLRAPSKANGSKVSRFHRNEISFTAFGCEPLFHRALVHVYKGEREEGSFALVQKFPLRKFRARRRQLSSCIERNLSIFHISSSLNPPAVVKVSLSLSLSRSLCPPMLLWQNGSKTMPRELFSAISPTVN